MSDIANAANSLEILANRPDLLELLKATAASKAEVTKETAASNTKWRFSKLCLARSRYPQRFKLINTPG